MSPTPGATLGSPALALSGAALFWSGNFIAGRALAGEVDPLTLNLLRWLLALLLLAPFFWRSTAVHLPVLRREWRLVLALGATGIASFHTLVYLALQNTSATSALLMLSLAPIAIMVGAGLIGMERLTSRQIAGALVSILGAGVLITRGRLDSLLSLGFNGGDLLMLFAVVIWAVYSLLLRRRPADLPPPVAMTGSVVAAVMLMLPLWLFVAPPPTPALVSAPVLLSIGYIGLFASAIAFLLWSYGVAQIGPSRAGQFVHLMPVSGPGLAFALLGEVPTPGQLAGAALVLSGILIVEYRARPAVAALVK